MLLLNDLLPLPKGRGGPGIREAGLRLSWLL